MKKAFSLLELVIAITLLGVMAILTFNYLNITSISKQNTKTQLLSHINLITASILQCKEYSNSMPIQNDGSLASETLLNVLECNTSTPYLLDGGKGAFIPTPLNGFSSYKATQVADEFYFSTTAEISSSNDEVLKDLEDEFSASQYELTHDATTAYMKFYLSR